MGRVEVSTATRSVAGIAVLIPTGSRHEPHGLNGVSHVLEHALLDGKPAGAAHSAGELLEHLGGEVNALTSAEYMAFYYRGPKTGIEVAAQLLLHAVLDPSLDAASWGRAQQVVIEELRALASDPAEAVKEVFAREVFGAHPLGRPVGGDAGSVGNISFKSGASYHRRRFRRSEAAVIVVGAPSVARTMSSDDRVRSTITVGGGAVGRRTRLRTPTRGAPVVRGEGANASLMIGARGVAYGDHRRSGYEVLATLLGASTTSILYESLRTKSALTYYLDAWHTPYVDTGLWRIQAACAAEHVGEVSAAVRQALQDVADGVSPEQLDIAKHINQGHWLTGCEGVSETALEVGRNRRVGRLADWTVERHAAASKRVTAADVEQAASAVLGGLTEVAMLS